MPSDFAVHSDILIHWTGKDIEKQYQNDKDREEPYLQRLRDILRFGLWMTDQEFEGPQNGSSVIPQIPGVCFTELKLSQSKTHSENYGRLGIGVKRMFIFDRGGRPVIYYGLGSFSPRDIFLDSCMKIFSVAGQETLPTYERIMHFFKPMNKSRALNYDLYSESEWRIIFHDGLTDKQVKDPFKNDMYAEYVTRLDDKQRRKLRYLIPLDGWFASIIYPTVDIKNRAQRDPEIRDLIMGHKVPFSDHPNKVEKGNLPVELDLDLCMNL